MLMASCSGDEILLRPFTDKPIEGASSPYAMLDNGLATECSSYKIFELKKSLVIVEMEEICHDDTMSKKKYPDEVRFTLRCPKALLEIVKQEAGERLGIVSVNQWIIEAINFRIRNRVVYPE